MVTYLYKGIKIYYEIVGGGTVPIVFLHGWGGGIDSFKHICKSLKFDYKALFIDFPPFGKSEEPQCNFTIYDYSELTLLIIKECKMFKPILVGHSFGGRIATILSGKGHASKLLLTSSAGMKAKHGLIYHFKVVKHKILKKLGLKSNGGSSDYKALSQNLRKTFVNIVNTNLEKYAIHINVPTLLVWGAKDKDTPLYMAKRFKKLIKGSELIVYKNAGHFCYLENAFAFSLILNAFVEE